MKRKYPVLLPVVFIAAAVTLSGCGLFSGSSRRYPYPEGWVVGEQASDDEEPETGGGKGNEGKAKATAGEKKEEVEETRRYQADAAGKKQAPPVPEKPKAVFFFDSSGSMTRVPEINSIHAKAERSCPGYDRRYYVLNKDGEIVETDEELAISGKYDNNTGAVLDVLGKKVIPVTSNGINILTTDLQTGTACSQIGAWLAEIGCESISFYIFSVDNDKNVDFYTYTSSSVREKVSVTECVFKRDFLMIVFGEERLVRSFDNEFSGRLSKDVLYEQCHVLCKNLSEAAESILELTPSRYFTDNLPNITYDSTRNLFNLRTVDTGETQFTLSNTFVFRKSRKSANDKVNAAKIVAYGIPEAAVPEIMKQQTEVLEYDLKKKTYVGSDLSFVVTAEAFPDGVPAADDEDLNERLGGSLVAAGKPAVVITVENEHLKKKLYAVDVSLICRGHSEKKDLRQFARRHSAGLEEYNAALKTECVPLKDEEGKDSRRKYVRTAKGDSVYSRLLEFERIADELDAAGYVVDNGEKVIRIRAIIDFR